MLKATEIKVLAPNEIPSFVRLNHRAAYKFASEACRNAYYDLVQTYGGTRGFKMRAHHLFKKDGALDRWSEDFQQYLNNRT